MFRISISNDSKIMDRSKLHTGRIYYYYQIVHDTKNRRPIEPKQVERNSVRQYCCKIDIIDHRISTHTTSLHFWNGRTMWIAIWKGMCRRHLRAEESTTTTPRSRIRRTCTVRRPCQSIRLSQPRATMENPE